MKLECTSEKKELVGREIPPYKSSEDAISRFLATTHAIGLTKKDGHLFIYAPYGLEDIFKQSSKTDSFVKII